MTVFNIAGREIHVDTYKTSWPISIVYKRQGVEIQVNPQTHWWCAWLCTTTDNADVIECVITLESAIEQPVTVKNSCMNCGDLIVRSGASWGISAPWEFQSVAFRGIVRFDDGSGAMEGSLVYS
jgi:hypothetical protein